MGIDYLASENASIIYRLIFRIMGRDSLASGNASIIYRLILRL